MTRTLSATLTTATGQAATQPVYLVAMGWETPVYAATWDTDIPWNSITWIASGIKISNLDPNGGTLELPLGDADPWLAVVLSDIPRSRTVDVYEYQTDFTASPIASDAVLVFSGYMDATDIGNNIRINMIESTQKKTFPPTWIDRPIYTHLPQPGTHIQWNNYTVVVNG